MLHSRAQPMQFEYVVKSKQYPSKNKRPVRDSSRGVGAASGVTQLTFGRFAGPALRRGFTIVELLIVIVVIAILAAISIVAYNGIQDRARTTAAMSAAKQVSDAVALYAVEHGDSYPSSLADVDIEDTDSTTYQYRALNSSTPATWCATVTVGNKSAYVSNTQTTPTEGACAGHGSGGVAAITNLVLNPRMIQGGSSAEMQTRWGWARSFPTDGDGPAGIDSYMRTTVSSGSVGSGRGVDWYTNQDISSFGSAATSVPVAAGETITISAWVRTSREANVLIRSRIHDGSTWLQGSSNGPATSMPQGEWRRLSQTITATSSGYLAVRVNIDAIGWTSTDWLDQTGLMITKDATLHAFADGNSPNWIWNGSPNASTSTGQAL